MTGTAFGPQGPNYTTVRPPADPQASGGADTFFKNCSSAGAKDGTFATADFFNVQLANLRYLVRTAAVPLSDADDTMVYQAIEALISAALVGGSGGPVPVLTAPKTYYVNAATGSDANDGLTVATPFLTVQKALTISNTFNMNGFGITINVANGTYIGPFHGYQINGTGSISIVGNVASPSAVVFASATGSALIFNGGPYDVTGVKFTCTGTISGDIGAGLWPVGGAVSVGACEFGACVSAHIAASGLAQVNINGPLTISGAAAVHMDADAQSIILLNALNPPALTITGTPNFSSAFIVANDLSVVRGKYSSITGTATGSRYIANTNSIVNSGGMGISYYPGNAAGTLNSGSQYA